MRIYVAALRSTNDKRKDSVFKPSLIFEKLLLVEC